MAVLRDEEGHIQDSKIRTQIQIKIGRRSDREEIKTQDRKLIPPYFRAVETQLPVRN